MKRQACRYAIVRFMPFVETGEFANVGVVLVAPKGACFDFKLLRRRYGRVTRFFDDLDGRVYKAAMAGLSEELTRVQELAARRNGTSLNALFEEVIRPRETMIRFSEPGVTLVEQPQQAVQQLFAHYVERSFNTKRYRERVLDKTLRGWLTQAQLDRRFGPDQVGDDVFHVRFPFVAHEGQRAYRIIKPLHLGQTESSQILDHGGRWYFRLRELKKRRLLPKHVLLAVEGPEGDGTRVEAYTSAIEELSETGVNVIPYERRDEIIEFARG
ncbi:DUF3037 domain-containing protein [Arhodomonas sp. SL1]|uniref:DUF3037 domain-containing protein n=1 Tax=Arhodomonas sp. SL1 TaxID=3425691 RepID=UPI003F882211